MERIKKILSLLLFCTALWVIYILSALTTVQALVLILIDLTILLLILASRHRIRLHVSKTQLAIGLLLVAPIFALSYPQETENDATKAPPMARAITAQKGWKPFEPHAIASLIKQGKTVVVNMTAEWCLTCKVNSRLTFQDPRVQTHLFQSPQVVAMQGDWTQPSDTIHAFLKQHNRSGVPFTIIYGPNAPDGIILPELLTSGILLKAIEDATDFSCHSDTQNC